jgi:putative cell wall-binding protein
MMNIKNLFASVGLISLVALTSLVSTSTVKASSSIRISGQDRYETASQVAKSNWTNESENAVLVSGEGYADAVSASVLAKKLNAPILLTESSSLSEDAKSALNTLKPKNIYVVGGPASISASVENVLKAKYNVTRLGGNDRYATNLAVANKLLGLGVSRDNIIAVAGTGFSDALSVAPVAAAKDEILLLVNNDSSSMKNTEDFAKSAYVTVVGTITSVTEDTYRQLNADRRIDGGADRFATNLNVLNQFKDDFKTDKFYIANASGDGYADALVASAIAGKYSAPLVLADIYGADTTNTAIDYLNENVDEYDTDIYIIGGKGVMPDSIINRINSIVGDSSHYAEDLTDATDAVDSAENTLSQSELDHAKDLVDDLPDGDEKDELENRIEDIEDDIERNDDYWQDNDDSDDDDYEQDNNSSQKLSNATDAVKKVEKSKTKSNYDTATDKVNSLKNSDDKTELKERLDKIKSAVDVLIADADSKVTQAESSKTQGDIDIAKSAIDKIPDGWDVSDLKKRLDKIKQGTGNQNVEAAVVAVEKAEGSKLQADLDAATKLVDLLPAGTDKTALQNRLKAVQDKINQTNAQQALTKATEAVVKAENSKTQLDVDSAKKLVNALLNSSDKTSLLNRLQAIQEEIDQNGTGQKALDKATAAVEKAEGSKSQADVDKAKALVNGLLSGSDKTSLLDRLQAVQNEIDQVNSDKESLANATAAVVKAENSKMQEDYDMAKKLVDALPNSSDKTSLQDRLDILKGLLDNKTAFEEAVQAVEKAESSKTQSDVDSAKVLVDALANGTDKTSLLSRLQVIQKEIDQNGTSQEALDKANIAVSKAEKSKLQADVDSAKTLVEALSDSSDKDSLLDRLQGVQNEINQINNQKQALTEANDAVSKAENTKSQADYNSAKSLVDALPNSEDKTDLLNRLQAVKDEIDQSNANKEALNTATKAVEKAESSKIQADVNSAKALVDSLPNSSDKTSLQERLQAVQNGIDQANADQEALNAATQAVIKAEGSKLQTDVDNAEILVNNLPNNENKTSLKNRLNSIQNPIITTHEQFYNAIVKALKSYNSILELYVDSYDSAKYNLNNTINEIEINSPDAYGGYKKSYSSAYINQNPVKIELTFEYYDTQNNLIKKQNEIDTKINQIISSIITTSMTDYEKELALHDYLVNNCQYDPRVIAGNTPDNSDDTYNAYGALINNVAVCQGYADAMYRLLKAVGIESTMVSGTASNGEKTEDHAWNIVKIGGQYYQLDSTWDDPTYWDQHNEPTHDYFNVTDDFLSQDHTWDKSQYPVCNSTEYAYKEI